MLQQRRHRVSALLRDGRPGRGHADPERLRRRCGARQPHAKTPQVQLHARLLGGEHAERLVADRPPRLPRERDRTLAVAGAGVAREHVPVDEDHAGHPHDRNGRHAVQPPTERRPHDHRHAGQAERAKGADDPPRLGGGDGRGGQQRPQRLRHAGRPENGPRGGPEHDGHRKGGAGEQMAHRRGEAGGVSPESAEPFDGPGAHEGGGGVGRQEVVAAEAARNREDGEHGEQPAERQGHGRAAAQPAARTHQGQRAQCEHRRRQHVVGEVHRGGPGRTRRRARAGAGQPLPDLELGHPEELLAAAPERHEPQQHEHVGGGQQPPSKTHAPRRPPPPPADEPQHERQPPRQPADRPHGAEPGQHRARQCGERPDQRQVHQAPALGEPAENDRRPQPRRPPTPPPRGRRVPQQPVDAHHRRRHPRAEQHVRGRQVQQLAHVQHRRPQARGQDAHAPAGIPGAASLAAVPAPAENVHHHRHGHARRDARQAKDEVAVDAGRGDGPRRQPQVQRRLVRNLAEVVPRQEPVATAGERHRAADPAVLRVGVGTGGRVRGARHPARHHRQNHRDVPGRFAHGLVRRRHHPAGVALWQA